MGIFSSIRKMFTSTASIVESVANTTTDGVEYLGNEVSHLRNVQKETAKQRLLAATSQASKVHFEDYLEAMDDIKERQEDYNNFIKQANSLT